MCPRGPSAASSASADTRFNGTFTLRVRGSQRSPPPLSEDVPRDVQKAWRSVSTYTLQAFEIYTEVILLNMIALYNLLQLKGGATVGTVSRMRSVKVPNSLRT